MKTKLLVLDLSFDVNIVDRFGEYSINICLVPLIINYQINTFIDRIQNVLKIKYTLLQCLR